MEEEDEEDDEDEEEDEEENGGSGQMVLRNCFLAMVDTLSKQVNIFHFTLYPLIFFIYIFLILNPYLFSGP